jgi:hypothetical protein
MDMNIGHFTKAGTLNGVLLELTSGLSALNMPSPEANDPKMTVHAYAHFEEAIRALSEIINSQGVRSTP